MNQSAISLSKFLSYVLRHQPQSIGLQLDSAGWAHVEELQRRCRAAGRPFTHSELEDLVRRCDKQRFALSEDGRRIRANQGHTAAVELGHPRAIPPASLYHGTARRFLASILDSGLLRGERHDVHLTDSQETALAVGQRYGVPVLLRIDAGRMHADGFAFRCSENLVWLVEEVPPTYLEVL